MSNIKVMLVEDHVMIRDLFLLAFKRAKGISVVGEADNGKDALKKIKECQPDVVLLDLNLPDISGLEITKRLVQRYPDIKIIIVTGESGEEKPKYLLRAGAHGYIRKGESLTNLIKAVKLIHQGERYISPEVANQIAFMSVNKKNMDSLTNKEIEIMLMLVKGFEVRKIADHLNLSPKTVHSYRNRISRKLDVKNDVELTHKAIEYGMLDIFNMDDKN